MKRRPKRVHRFPFWSNNFASISTVTNFRPERTELPAPPPPSPSAARHVSVTMVSQRFMHKCDVTINRGPQTRSVGRLDGVRAATDASKAVIAAGSIRNRYEIQLCMNDVPLQSLLPSRFARPWGKGQRQGQREGGTCARVHMQRIIFVYPSFARKKEQRDILHLRPALYTSARLF